jgi:hypothetical protein
LSKPKNVAIAVTLLWIAVLGGSASSLVRAAFNQAIPPNFFVIMIASVGFMAFLIVNISAGKNWARITFATIFILGIIPWLAVMVFRFSQIPIQAVVIGVINIVLQSCALYLLFTNPGSSWFRKDATSTSRP